jgi:tRNA/tmRNA/rRNA uracil-C5-methylase (TrmA/RlmC/RlmD family)
LCIDATHIRKLDINLFRGKKIFAITDPPRTGMDKKTIQYLLEAKPQCIIYVSCNPRQMAKELIPFMRLYSLASVALFDMFPQTNHIEVIAELKLKV